VWLLLSRTNFLSNLFSQKIRNSFAPWQGTWRRDEWDDDSTFGDDDDDDDDDDDIRFVANKGGASIFLLPRSTGLTRLSYCGSNLELLKKATLYCNGR
jgi:hypothetical protein